MIPNDELFAGLCQATGGTLDRRGHVHISCPSCGKEPKRGQTHCSFSVRGWKCFVCGEGGTLWRLAQLLEATPIRPTRIHQMAQEPPKPRHWQNNPQAVLDGFLESLDRVEQWQRYKPLTLESISRWKLGVGRLPFVDDITGRTYEGKYRRLILPTFADGKLVALEGRAFHPDDTAAKWICATGSSKQALFNGDLLTPGATVILCENKVDAILAMQETPGIVAVSGGGVIWREEWTAQIVASRPRRVIVWLDNDLAGQPNAETYPIVLDAWRRRMMEARASNPHLAHQPFPAPPEPAGPRIATRLLAAGVTTTLYHWPAGTPPKADLGAALMGAMGAAA
jgi:predicted RNA-binding Zn-ribbon protein involved in translation (DUF1610 family)